MKNKIYLLAVFSIFLLPLLPISVTEVAAQNNSLILNGAYIVLDGGTSTTNIYVVVAQSSTTGIIRPGGGHISSEGQYNFVKWTSGASTGNYIFPFGVGGNPADYIPFTFNKTTPGSSDISMSTWMTNPQNTPHPTVSNVAAVSNMIGIPDSVKNAIDRFWDIHSPAPVSANLTFSYRGSENTTAAPTDTFKTQHWNGMTWDPQAGPGNPGVTTGIGTVGPIPGRQTFSPWVLTRAILSTHIISSQDLICNNQCTGTASATSAGGTPPYTYSWNPGGQNTIIATGLCAATYSVIVTDAANSTVIDTITIMQPTAISNSVTPTNLTCNAQCNGFATLTTSGGTPGYSYSWNTSPVQTTSNATELCAGTFSVTVTDANGCTHTNSVSITQPAAITATATVAPTICNGNTGSATVNASGGTGGFTYDWNPSAQSGQTATGLATGTYSVIISDSNGCTTITTASVTAVSGPSVTATASAFNITLGNNTQLTATGGGTYAWSPATGLSCTTCPNPTATPKTTTNYCALVTNASGCTDSACITINVDIPCGIIFVPNAFSPNNDGSNDMHCVLGNCIESFHFTIYNRWGQLVFESSDQQNCWDGMYKGKLEDTSVFVYYMEATLINGEKVKKKGNISLVR